MKQFTIFIAFCISLLSAQAQDRDIREGIHVFNFAANLTQCDATGTSIMAGNPATAVVKRVEGNWRFKIYDMVGANYIINILEFPTGYGNEATLNNSFVEASNQTVYFLLPATTYNQVAERFKSPHSFTVGAATTLIKIRPGSKEPIDGKWPVYFDFANDFNIGVLFGYKYKPWRKIDFASNFLAGISVTSIGIDSLTTKGIAKSPSNSSGLTFSLGYVAEFNKFQFGVFSGLDMLTGEVGRNWVYRNRPWIGLTLGYSIFRTQGSPESQSK
ncbi:MAG: hypothetical protein JWP69_1330 [Flaviaesturariibacter sp.]|nr:hypothetical protein [Flaviaesturariibacter sp.]